VSIDGRRMIWGLLAVLALGAAGACGGGGYGSSPSPMPTPSPATAADVTITILGMNGSNSYSPSAAAVKVGQTVAWRNSDSIAHTATGTGFDTGAIAGGTTSAPIRVTAAGTITYHCSIHPTMVGSLNVTQ
jgi:plastocyanin